MDGESLPVRDVVPAHKFNEARLDAWLTANVPGLGRELKVQQFQGGASNPTFLLTTQTDDGPRRYVLRKKPPGTLLASAHQVDREFRVMSALAKTDVPVPTMRGLCTDDSVIGTAFYVMDFLPGRIFRLASLPDLAPAERAEVYDQLNLTLARLHKVDPVAVGLGDYGKPGGYFERQVGRWTKQYRGAATDEIPAMEALIAELPGRIPAGDEVCIAHGDYRLENVMFAPDRPELIAVLDWELSTLGHPMADIAYNCFLWRSHGESWGTLDGVDFAASGIPTEAEYRDRYLERTGRGPVSEEDWAFYMAFSIFRLASISQGVYARILKGQLAMEREAINGTPALAEQALDILHGGSGR
jgi:aminoglycoside phosphotransferase (APT) family kinase protein